MLFSSAFRSTASPERREHVNDTQPREKHIQIGPEKKPRNSFSNEEQDVTGGLCDAT